MGLYKKYIGVLLILVTFCEMYEKEGGVFSNVKNED